MESDDRAAAVRYAVGRFLDGLGAVSIMREMAAAGMSMTDSGKLNSGTLYRTLRNRVLVGERAFDVGGEVYRLAGYYRKSERGRE